MEFKLKNEMTELMDDYSNKDIEALKEENRQMRREMEESKVKQ